MSAAKTTLTSKQKSHLRGLAHHLEPVVMLGKESLTDSVVAATLDALLAHELIKVKLPQIERDERKTIAEDLATAAKASIVGELGRVLILYKRHPHKPTIELPKDKG